jgi:hypothetical protein
MKKVIGLFFTSLVLSLNSIAQTNISAPYSLPEYLQSISVQIQTTSGKGSGVAFTRKDSTGTNNITFIWSVGHIFEYETNNFINNILFGKSTVREIMPYCLIYQDVSINGEVVGETNALLRLIKYSEDYKNDLSLSVLECQFFNTNTAVFDLSKRIPKIGEKLYNVSSPRGERNTYSECVYSYIGRKMHEYLFDQTGCVIFPGSSGGGFYSITGQCVGLTDSMREPAMNYMVPIRRIQKWAKDENIEWALDPTLPIPTAKQIGEIPLHSNE